MSHSRKSEFELPRSPSTGSLETWLKIGQLHDALWSRASLRSLWWSCCGSESVFPYKRSTFCHTYLSNLDIKKLRNKTKLSVDYEVCVGHLWISIMFGSHRIFVAFCPSFTRIWRWLMSIRWFWLWITILLKPTLGYDSSWPLIESSTEWRHICCK